MRLPCKPGLGTRLALFSLSTAVLAGCAGATSQAATVPHPGREPDVDAEVTVTGQPPGRPAYQASLPTASHQVSFGDSVQATVGGFDAAEYTVHGEKGDKLVASILGDGSGDWEFSLRVRGRDPHSGEWRDLASSWAFSHRPEGRPSPTFALPWSGEYQVQVVGGDHRGRSSYTFVVHQVNPQPEQLTGEIALGKLVAGELIAHPGDIDEFVFNGEQGQRVSAVLRGAGEAMSYFTIELLRRDLESGTEAKLAEEAISPPVARLRPTWPTELPDHGQYVLRISPTYSEPYTTGPYVFMVRDIDSPLE